MVTPTLPRGKLDGEARIDNRPSTNKDGGPSCGKYVSLQKKEKYGDRAELYFAIH